MNKKFPLGLSDLLVLNGITMPIFTLTNTYAKNPSLAVKIYIAVFILGAVFWSIRKTYTDSESKFKLVHTMTGKEAKGANKIIKKTGESILVTHFTASYPSGDYVTNLIKRMDKGVSIVRIISNKAANDPKTVNWLKNFRVHHRYTEHLSGGEVLPFDVAIFDNKKVILYFPSHVGGNEYNQAIIFNHPKVASIFKSIFERLARDSVMTWDGGQPKAC